jgi:alpha,alpha-trehalase
MRQGQHAITLPGGGVLNRFWDSHNRPREEAFIEDSELAAANPQYPTLWRERRAGAESGWDFSSRWNAIPAQAGTIRTTDLAPIDLNCLLYRLEQKLGEWLGNGHYQTAAEARKALILAHCYDPLAGWFFDLEHANAHQSQQPTLAAVYALFFGLASPEQAARVAERLERDFLKAGGLVTTLFAGGEQWDAPNGWAPLQWLACLGLERYGFLALAQEIARRFVALARRVWRQSGKLMEKYNVVDTDLTAGGGEYPAQDGFGWTNGVLRAMIERYHLSDAPAGP